jgi:hypothetical protein
MTDYQVTQILLRLTALWPRQRDAGEMLEWKAVLRGLEHAMADRAVNELRDASTWPPTIADFRRAYRTAAALPAARPALPGQVADPKDVYGSGEWVYCWQCDRAISLADQADSSSFDAERGLRHLRCPESGPMIPAAERLKRSEWYERHRILATPAGR